MYKLVLIATALAVLVPGCSSAEAEAEKRRELFRVPEYGSTAHQEPTMDRAGQLLLEAAPYYHGAIAEIDPVKKKHLFREAVDRYKRALAELKALQSRTKDPRRREELGLIIMQVQDDLNDSLRRMPITGE